MKAEIPHIARNGFPFRQDITELEEEAKEDDRDEEEEFEEE